MIKEVLSIGIIFALIGCNSGGDGSRQKNDSPTAQGSVSGVVRDYHTGEPLEGVTISVSSQVNPDTDSISTESAADGSYTLEDIGISERFLLSAEMAQYGEVWNIFANTGNQADVLLSPLVLKAHINETLDSTIENTLSSEGYEVVLLPENSLVDQVGNPYSGQVITRITLIDPSSDASIMPGDFLAINELSGETSHIESFGAIDVDLSDTAGNPLQLQQGKTATITIPLASSIIGSNAPQIMPLYYFDEALGYWIEEGEATLISTEAGFAYQGQIGRFSTWNADMAYETVNVIGCVKDEHGQSVTGAKVIASGRDYIGQSYEYSDAFGNFTVPVRKSSNVLISSISNAQSDTAIVDSLSIDTTMPSCLALSQGAAIITLTWNENPRDLDTHFYGPIENDVGEFEVYFETKTVEVAGILFDLDVDDTSSYGPEVLTIPDFPLEGTYRYVIDRYAGSSTIKDSPARVVLNLAGEIQVFSPDSASGDSNHDYWHVFNLEVDVNGDVSVQPVQQFSMNESAPALGAPLMRIQSFNESSGSQVPTKKRELKYYSAD